MFITALTRGLLLNQEGAGGAGGGAVTFTAEQQAKVDQIVQERLAKAKNEAAEAKKAHDELKAEFTTLKEQLTELQTSAERTKEEALLAGKNDLEKAQHKFEQSQKRIKELEDQHKAATAKWTADLESERNARTQDAKRNWATQTLATGAAEGMSPYAISALLSEAELELDDKLQVVRATFEGVAHEKPADLATAFYKARPGFAKPPAGGTGQRGPGNGAGAANGLEAHTSPQSLIGAGLASRTQT